MVLTILLIINAYFFCSIPTSWIVAKLAKGVDLRTYGSGSLTTSNAGRALGKWALGVVGVLDVLKGAAPVWAAQFLDRSISAQMLVGIAGVAGHNWSVFMNFQGGRGMAVVIGVMLALARMQLLLFLIVAIFGVAFTGNVPLIMGVSMFFIPFWSYLFEEDKALIWGFGIIVALIFAKRLTGNWTPLPDEGKGDVLLNRFLYDRDTKDKQSWVKRTAVDNSAATENHS